MNHSEILAGQIETMRDKILTDAINSRIGKNWTTDDLHGRLTRVGNRYWLEVYALDGVDLVEIKPAQLVQQSEFKFCARLDYRYLGG